MPLIRALVVMARHIVPMTILDRRPATMVYAESQPADSGGPPRESERTRTAYHEAAHALLVHGMGGFVTSVDGAGQTSYAWPPAPATGAQETQRMHDMVQAVVLYGGPVAEALAQRPEESPGTVAIVQACQTVPYLQDSPDRDRHHDFDRVAEIVRGRFDPENGADFRYLLTAARLAEHLVRTHWDTIQRIAQTALYLGLVDGALFGRLLSGEVGRGDFRQTLEGAQF